MNHVQSEASLATPSEVEHVGGTSLTVPHRVRRIGLLTAAFLALVPAALAAQGAGEEGGGGSALFQIDTGLSIWAAFVFLILLGVLWRFAWGPLLSLVEAREKRIQDALDDSAERQAEALRVLEEHKAQLAEARRHAQEILAEGRAAGDKVRREIEEKAREEGQALLERARNEIQREKDAALAELRRESVDLALAAASRLMRERLDRDGDRELVMGYLEELSASDRGASA